MAENPERHRVGGLQNTTIGAILDSTVARAVPTHQIHPLTGTGALTSMTPPWAGFSGIVYFLPDGASTVATGGSTNGFAKAATHVANRAIGYVYNPVTDLWWPIA